MTRLIYVQHLMDRDSGKGVQFRRILRGIQGRIEHNCCDQLPSQLDMGIGNDGPVTSGEKPHRHSFHLHLCKLPGRRGMAKEEGVFSVVKGERDARGIKTRPQHLSSCNLFNPVDQRNDQTILHVCRHLINLQWRYSPIRPVINWANTRLRHVWADICFCF